jgi:hypothetical protein
MRAVPVHSQAAQQAVPQGGQGRGSREDKAQECATVSGSTLLSDLASQALSKGNTEDARIYAGNAIRKKNESLNLLRLASR